MRILQVDSGREWRGGQNQVRLLCQELARERDVELRLATKHGSELMQRCMAAGVLVHGVPWGIGLDPRAWWYLRSFLWSFRPDVVHVHDSHALALVRAALWDMTRPALRGPGRWNPLRRWRARLIAPWRHAAWNPPALVAHRRVDFRLRRPGQWLRADRVIAVSEAVKRVLVSDGVNPRDVTVVPDGIDPDEVRRAAAAPLGIRARLGLPPGAPLAVNVAALVGHKDQCTLIRAAHAARDIAPDLHWVVAGEGELRSSLERDIADLSVGDRVHLLGFVPEADALIREGDVFVMSSREEGLGSVVLHALALGKAVVATRAGGLPEIVPAEWLVPVGDPVAMALKVVDALGHHSAVPFPTQCTAAAMAQAVLACYRSLA